MVVEDDEGMRRGEVSVLVDREPLGVGFLLLFLLPLRLLLLTTPLILFLLIVVVATCGILMCCVLFWRVR